MSLHTGIDPWQPATFARSDNGWFYIVNGLDISKKWNGISSSVVRVGVPAPTDVPTLLAGGGGVNYPNGTYTVYIRWVDDDGFVSNLTAAAATVTVSSQAISVSGLPTSAPSRVAKLQILRNTSGQNLVYYVDTEILVASLGLGTASLTLSDTNLATQTAVPLFDTDGNSLANRFDLPRTDKPIIVSHQGRLFMAGHVPYRRGHASVTISNNTVRGSGTNWNSDMIGRLFHVYGHDPNYTISNVDVSDQSLILSAVYAGSTNPFALYTIEGTPASRNILYWSESALPDAWPAVNGLEVGDSGDNITGLLVTQTFLYVLQRRSTHRLTYSNSPTDGAAFRASLRGCVNQRCWVREGAVTYLLDSQGVYRFTGSEEVESITPPISDLFWGENESQEFRINWDASTYFHALHDRREKVIRWFVSLGYDYLPRHCIAYDYNQNAWWIEYYPFRVGGSAVFSEQFDLPLLGGPAKRVFGHRGTLDGVVPEGTKTLRGFVTSATTLSLTDSTATFPSDNLVGNPISLVEGRGAGQQRIITTVSGTTITVDVPWLVMPDSTTKYQLGGIQWTWRSRRFLWNRSEAGNRRRVELIFRPTSIDSQVDLRLLPDYQTKPEQDEVTWALDDLESQGVRCKEGFRHFAVDTDSGTGLRQASIYGVRDNVAPTLDGVTVEVKGCSVNEQLRLHRVAIEGVEAPDQPAKQAN